MNLGETFQGNCPYCYTRAVGFKIEYTRTRWQLLPNGDNRNRMDVLAICGHCDRTILAEFELVEYEEPELLGIFPSPSEPPEYLPEFVALYFRQGVDNLPQNYDAAGVMFRTALEAGLSSFQLQPIVKCLMKTLLEDHPTLLSDTERSNLMNSDYCKHDLGLKLSNLALLRHALRNGEKIVSGYPRYWAKRYADRYYVCSQWWKDHHCHNARMLRRFVDRLANRNLDDLGILALKRHGDALARFEQECQAV